MIFVDLAKLLTEDFKSILGIWWLRIMFLWIKLFIISLALSVFSSSVGMWSTCSLNCTESKLWQMVLLRWKKSGVIMTQSTYLYFLVSWILLNLCSYLEATIYFPFLWFTRACATALKLFLWDKINMSLRKKKRHKA